jgi:divinyl chlorophyllide a 8-vinyl-reductase
MTPITAFLLPGLHNSGPDHWQSVWERTDPTCQRLVQADWATPRCSDWAAVLDAAVVAHDGPVVLVAHSSSNITVAAWARSASPAALAKVRGALLVAPSDPDGPAYPAGPSGFSPVPLQRLPFRSIVVASTNDEYCTIETARAYAAAWGSEFVDVGARGHINGDSGLGDWPDGRALLAQLRAEPSAAAAAPPKRVFMVGATGTIGRATVRALVRHGHEVVCFVRAKRGRDVVIPGATVRTGDVTKAESIARDGLCGERFEAVVSCMASRTGGSQDAWAVDHDAQQHLLQAAKAAGVSQFVLLSAICVQKPLLAFQHAKLAFEKALMTSGLTYSIVRPTAFFKSISGQVKRVQQGKPFLLFGDGTLTACKPISDDDLAEFLATCLTDASRANRVLPIGGPGPAVTLRQQGELLFTLAGKPPRFTRVPVAMFDGIIGVLRTLGMVIPPLRDKAEFAAIGRYYATESMLLWDPVVGRYDADATPSFGSETLASHYARLLRGEIADDRGEHAVF